MSDEVVEPFMVTEVTFKDKDAALGWIHVIIAKANAEGANLQRFAHDPLNPLHMLHEAWKDFVPMQQGNPRWEHELESDAVSTEGSAICECCGFRKMCRMYVLQNGQTAFVCASCRTGKPAA
jgi:hypothetical protein